MAAAMAAIAYHVSGDVYILGEGGGQWRKAVAKTLIISKWQRNQQVSAMASSA